MNVNPDSLRPAQYDIMVDGKRYGVAIRVQWFNWTTRMDQVAWKAVMDLPDRFKRLPVYDRLYEKADSMDEAVLKAFEEFARGGELSLDEYARIGMALFCDVPADVLAAI